MYSIRNLVMYFLRLGTVGFGGPVALVESMHQALVIEKKWITEDDYKEGLALAQLAPGPLAAQLAIYIGYVHYRIPGATLTGLAFVLPSFLMVIAIGYTYVAFSGLPWMQAIFYGVGSAVIGIIATSGYRLTRKSIGKDFASWIIFLTVAIITYFTESEMVWLVIVAGLFMWIVKSPPGLPFSGNHLFSPLLLQVQQMAGDSQLVSMAWFFTKAGALVFGSGLAIVPFLYGAVVKDYHWLTEQQFLDAVAVAMITPGPVVITVGFIGYLIAGFPGACVAAVGTFFPCYLFTILLAPQFKKYGKLPAVKAFIDGVTAAAIGAIAGAVLILGQRTLVDMTTVCIAAATAMILLWFRKIREPWILLACGVIGLILKMQQ